MLSRLHEGPVSLCKECTWDDLEPDGERASSRQFWRNSHGRKRLSSRRKVRHMACDLTGMNIHIAKLYNAQRVLRTHPAKSPEWVAIINSLRKTVPAPILAHFLRIAANGCTAIAEVHNGVCSSCHIRVPSSQVALVTTTQNEVHVCEYCGSFLVLPEAEAPALPDSTEPQHRGRKNSRTLVA